MGSVVITSVRCTASGLSRFGDNPIEQIALGEDAAEMAVALNHGHRPDAMGGHEFGRLLHCCLGIQADRLLIPD